MATSKIPFRGNSVGEIYDSILNNTPPPATRLNPNLPAEVERVIDKCLEKDRNLRYQHASAPAKKVGVVRFTRIGFPHPCFSAHFVGTFEILCGFLLLVGLCTRLVSIPLLIVITTAIATTKIQSCFAPTKVSGTWSAMAAPILPCSAAWFFSSQLVAGAGLLTQGLLGSK